MNGDSADMSVYRVDQSGGSTPKALKAYGLSEDAWSNVV